MAVQPSEGSTPDAPSVKHPEFETSNNHNCCTDEGVEEGSKARVSNAESSIREEQLCHKIEHLQKPKSGRSKRKSLRSDCAKKRRDNFSGCNCAAKFAGDCAAVCCCPCVIVHLLILALVKLPFAIARKAFFCAKKMAPIDKKSDNKRKTEKNNDDDDDDKSENCRVYSPSWSYRESPQMTEPLEGLPSPRFDSHKLWSELYATGHMGFGGVPCERD